MLSMKKINLLSNKDDDIDDLGAKDENKTKEEIIWSEPDEKEETAAKTGLFSGWFSFFKKAGKENRLIAQNRLKDSRRELIKLIKSENDQPETKPNKPSKINKSKPKSEISVASKPKKARDESRPTKWEKLSIMGTNLIKGEIISFFDWRKKISVLLTAAISAFLIIAVAYGGLIFLESKEINKGRYFVDKINEINQRTEQAEDYVKEILIFKKKMKLAGELLDRHIYWTDFFEFLEKNTLADVYYSGFSGNIGGEYALSATAKSFSAIARQTKIMRDNGDVLQAKVSGGQSGKEGGSVGFQLELSVNPDIFIK